MKGKVLIVFFIMLVSGCSPERATIIVGKSYAVSLGITIVNFFPRKQIGAVAITILKLTCQSNRQGVTEGQVHRTFNVK